MRTAVFSLLGVAAVAGYAMRGSDPHVRADVAPPPRVVSKVAAPFDDKEKFAVKSGWKASREAAVDAAFAAAATTLAQRVGSTGWQPSPEFVKRLVRARTVEEKTFEDPIGVMYEATAVVEITAADRAEIARFERDIRSRERMLLLARWLSVAVLGLAGVAGYVRADVWSKGHLTGWLRLAVVAFVTIAGVAALLIG